jgi:transcriptional regulator with XRE-family HTH domain
MDAAPALRAARQRSGLSQAALAARAGTSQATVSAYESGRKQPSVATLSRLLAAAGSRLAIEPAERPVLQVGEDRLTRRARTLEQVLGLAEALPTRHERTLRYPRLDVRQGRMP